MRKLQNFMGIIMFFALVVMLGISTVFFSEGDTKKLLQSKDSAQEYICENFPFLDNFKSLHSKTASLMGQRVFDGVLYDKDNDRLIKLFEDGGESDKYVDGINSFHESNSEIPTYVMLIPTASGIYRSDLEELSSTVDQQSLIDELYYDIDEEVTPLDVYNALYSTRDDYIYFRTDDRWTQQGAYEAYSVSASKLGLQIYSLSNYDIDYTHTYFNGELSEITGIRDTESDTINVCRCKYGSYVKSAKIIKDKQTYTKTSIYTRSGLREDDKYSYFFGSSKFKCARIETASEDSPKLLIIGSDYVNCFAAFLAPHYSQITVLCPENFDEDEQVSDFASIDDYDQVIFMYDLDTFCSGKGADKLN